MLLLLHCHTGLHETHERRWRDKDRAAGVWHGASVTWRAWNVTSGKTSVLWKTPESMWEFNQVTAAWGKKRKKKAPTHRAHFIMYAAFPFSQVSLLQITLQCWVTQSGDQKKKEKKAVCKADIRATQTWIWLHFTDDTRHCSSRLKFKPFKYNLPFCRLL